MRAPVGYRESRYPPTDIRAVTHIVLIKKLNEIPWICTTNTVLTYDISQKSPQIFPSQVSKWPVPLTLAPGTSRPSLDWLTLMISSPLISRRIATFQKALRISGSKSGSDFPRGNSLSFNSPQNTNGLPQIFITNIFVKLPKLFATFCETDSKFSELISPFTRSSSTTELDPTWFE